VIGENLPDAELPGDFLGTGLRALAEGCHLHTGGCPVRQYVNSAEAAANHTDLYSFLLGCLCHTSSTFSFSRNQVLSSFSWISKKIRCGMKPREISRMTDLLNF